MERLHFLLFWKYCNARSNIGWIRTITYGSNQMGQNPVILCINQFYKHEINWLFCHKSYSLKWQKSAIAQSAEPLSFRPRSSPQSKSEFQTNHILVFSDTKRNGKVCYITIKKRNENSILLQCTVKCISSLLSRLRLLENMAWQKVP